MASIEEFRRWLRGGKVENLPDWPDDKEEAKAGRVSKVVAVKVKPLKKGKIDIEKMEKKREARRCESFTLAADGRDAKLNFGEHNGALVSNLSETHPDYLTWLLSTKDPFPEALLEVVRAHLRFRRPPKRGARETLPFDDDEDFPF